MTIGIPSWLQWVSYLVGEEWPEGDEDAMQRLASSWRASADELTSLVPDLNRVKEEIRSSMLGMSAEAIDKTFKEWFGGDYALDKLAEAMDGLAELSDGHAMEVQYTKLIILTSLAIAAVEIAYALAASPWTLGGSLAAIPGIEAITMAAVQRVMSQLLKQIVRKLGEALTKTAVKRLLKQFGKAIAIETVVGVGQEVGIQAYQRATGTRNKMNWGQVGDTTVSSAAGAVAGELTGMGAGRLLGNGSTRMGGAVRGALTGYASGVTGNLAGTAALMTYRDGVSLNATSIFGGAASGALSGGVHGSRVDAASAGPQNGTPTDTGRPDAGSTDQDSRTDGQGPGGGQGGQRNGHDGAPQSGQQGGEGASRHDGAQQQGAPASQGASPHQQDAGSSNGASQQTNNGSQAGTSTSSTAHQNGSPAAEVNGSHSPQQHTADTSTPHQQESSAPTNQSQTHQGAPSQTESAQPQHSQQTQPAQGPDSSAVNNQAQHQAPQQQSAPQQTSTQPAAPATASPTTQTPSTSAPSTPTTTTASTPTAPSAAGHTPQTAGASPTSSTAATPAAHRMDTAAAPAARPDAAQPVQQATSNPDTTTTRPDAAKTDAPQQRVGQAVPDGASPNIDRTNNAAGQDKSDDARANPDHPSDSHTRDRPTPEQTENTVKDLEQHRTDPDKGATAEDTRNAHDQSQAVRDKWNNLSQQERDAIIARETRPGNHTKLGDLDGLPGHVRDILNRHNLVEDMVSRHPDQEQAIRDHADAMNRHAADPETHRRPEPFDPTGEKPSLRNRLASVFNGNAPFKNVDAAWQSTYGAPHSPDTPIRQLLTYDPKEFGGDGRIAVAVGDLDAATVVSVHTPGITSTIRSIEGNITNAENHQIKSTQQRPDQTHAVIAWIGYDAPSGVGLARTPSTHLARTGGNRLAHDIAALAGMKGDGTRLNMFGHSYGSTTTAFAGAGGRLGTYIDSVTLLGSPGAGPMKHASEFGIDPQSVFVASNSHDLVTWVGADDSKGFNRLTGRLKLGGLGMDPAMRDFGAVRIAAEYSSPQHTSGLITAHVNYFSTEQHNTAGDSTPLRIDPHARPTESLQNFVDIATGDTHRVSLEAPRESASHDPAAFRDAQEQSGYTGPGQCVPSVLQNVRGDGVWSPDTLGRVGPEGVTEGRFQAALGNELVRANTDDILAATRRGEEVVVLNNYRAEGLPSGHPGAHTYIVRPNPDDPNNPLVVDQQSGATHPWPPSDLTQAESTRIATFNPDGSPTRPLTPEQRTSAMRSADTEAQHVGQGADQAGDNHTSRGTDENDLDGSQSDQTTDSGKNKTPKRYMIDDGPGEPVSTRDVRPGVSEHRYEWNSYVGEPGVSRGDILEHPDTTEVHRTRIERDFAPGAHTDFPNSTVQEVEVTVGRNTAVFTVVDGHPARVDFLHRETYDPVPERPSSETSAQRDVGAGHDGDDAGHMSAFRFTLDQEFANLFPQDANFNRGAFKTMENEWASFIEHGGEIYARVDLHPPSERPDRVSVEYVVNRAGTNEEVYFNRRNFNNSDGETFKRLTTEQIIKKLSEEQGA